MLIAIHGVILYAQCYAMSEAICSLLCIELSFILIALQGVKLYPHCYTWSEALCLVLYKE